MNDLLFDSSVWVNFFRGIIMPQTELLNSALQNDWNVWVCPPVVQEVLQGVKHDVEWKKVYDVFLYLERLDGDPYEMAVDAAKLYRVLRQKGITVRKPNDCLIAAYALKFDKQLVYTDIDFDQIARVFPLKRYIPA